MHSGVFARNPEAAGDAALAFVGSGPGARPVLEAEVVDADEAPPGAPGRLRIHGRLRVPGAAFATAGEQGEHADLRRGRPGQAG